MAEGLRPSSTTATTTSNEDRQSQPDSQYNPHSPSASVSDSRQTAQTLSTSPMSRSSIQGAPLFGDKCSSEAAVGVNSSSYSNSRIEASPPPHSMIANVPFPQLNARPGSGPDPMPDPTSCPLPDPVTGASSGSVVGPSPGWMPAHHPQVASPPNSIWSSTFTIPAKTIRNTQGNKRAWIWLAPWSTWSFTVRLTLMLSEKLHPEDSSLPPSLFSTETYSLTYKTSVVHDLPDVTGLPSLSHALYLFSTVKFHLGQTYQLYDEEEFEQEIRDFYPNALQKATECPLWFSKFLLTLAFGTAFHTPPRDSPDPPGCKFFIRAMALMPDSNSLWKDGFLAMEVLALGGLYLYSVDQREGALFFLSQAIRIAQLEGMHTHLPEHELGTKMATYARDLWWTLYIMDRHFSSSVGLPMSVQDSDITTLVNPPGMGTTVDSARSLQVNLSHLMSVILTTVYKPGVTKLATFLEQTRSILHTLAHHAQDIERIISTKFQNFAGTMPRDTRLLTLLYHQCVIFASRPLLLSVMKERLDILGFQGDEDWTDFLAQTGSVISTGIKSAAKTLQILTSEFSVLDAFLPYDVEFTFGAALNLTMANALFPDVVDYNSCQEMAHQILDDLVYRGNRVARARRSELCHLEGLCHELISRGQRQGLQTLQLLVPEPQAINLGRKPSGNQESLLPAENVPHPLTRGVNASQTMHIMSHPQPTSDMEFLDNIGISSEEFLSIVQGMGSPETFPDIMLTLD
ncbi:C6 transcription factor [Ilyonectria destructans]|nr:C6 transcription factor [Ilyonectria destructans]